jgi:hypothetical protein
LSSSAVAGRLDPGDDRDGEDLAGGTSAPVEDGGLEQVAEGPHGDVVLGCADSVHAADQRPWIVCWKVPQSRSRTDGGDSDA